MDTRNTIHLVHILFAGPLLIYIGGAQTLFGTTLNNITKYFLIFLGITLILYHGMNAYKMPARTISWLHVLLVGPLFLWAGLANNLPYALNQLLVILGAGLIVYHALLMMM
jgi:hypothetical protein